MRRLLLVLLVALVLAPAAAAADGIRFATFNASLNRGAEGVMIEHMSNPHVEDIFRQQIRNVAEVIQRVRPDVLLINEFDYVEDAEGRHPALDLFHDNFLLVGQNGQAPISYPYRFAAPSNTGIPSGRDFDKDGRSDWPQGTGGYGNDSFGFGLFPGQFAMAVYSKYPIDPMGIRTFQMFRWKDMPGAMLPIDPATGESWYDEGDLEIFRLSSKSHWDIPVRIGRHAVHLLAAHPTPPVFDGPENRNGTRNHDEIRLWADYVVPGRRSAYIYDDQGRRGGLRPGSLFVIAGDYNSDPFDGDSVPGSAQQLLEHPLVNTKLTPWSDGAVEAAELQGLANETHIGPHEHDTADFNPVAPGNLRVDYVLPHKALRMLDARVFWPVQADPLFRLTGVFGDPWRPVGGFPTSDHRLVWVDVSVPGAR
jgi:hypothetical protein